LAVEARIEVETAVCRRRIGEFLVAIAVKGKRVDVRPVSSDLD